MNDNVTTDADDGVNVLWWFNQSVITRQEYNVRSITLDSNFRSLTCYEYDATFFPLS